MPPLMNAWSLLYEELKMSENFEDRYEDGLKSPYWYDYDRNDPDRANPFMGTLAGAESADTITFSGADDFQIHAAAPVPFDSFMTFGEDEISFDLNMNNKDTNRYKYNEDAILKELQEYISGTYNQHYSAGDDKIQTLDLIEACGDGEAFCRSNILKYASRYDKKGTSRRDILKIMHYAVLLMHFNDKNAQRETYPQ